MELSVYTTKGKESGKKITLPSEVFGITPNEHCVYLDVKHYLANQRQGTHKAKERAEVSRSTRKIKKQKGTGGARAGSLKSPLFKGGGTIFGPRPRDYDFKLNKKVKVLARKSVLSSKAIENKITVVEDFTFETPKTKDFLAILASLSLSNKKTLVVLADNNANVILSGRNIPKTNISFVDKISTYDLINTDVLVLLESSVSKFTEKLA